jgi:predicted nucleic acid-binding protein
MNASKVFFDTNVIFYLLSDATKADRAEELLAQGGIVSVQVLNEFVAVARRKTTLSWREIGDVLRRVRQLCMVVPLSVQTHDRALVLAQRHRMPIYDALIIVAALLAGCRKVYSEDMQHGQVFARQLTVRNPFV